MDIWTAFGMLRPSNYDEFVRDNLRKMAEERGWVWPDEAPAAAAPEPQRRARGSSKATDDKAREAYKLYYTDGLTQAQIAELKAVTPKTVGRWLKRARELQNRTE